MGGVPCIRGPGIPIAAIVARVAEGMTPDKVVELLSDLQRGDISEALRFAAESVR